MNENQIKEMLDKLDHLQVGLDALNLQKQALTESVMTPEIKAKLLDIDAEFAPKIAAISDSINPLTAEIKQAVISIGTSVKGAFLYAVWAKGRVSWDNKSLDGYALAHPELNTFRKEGEPSVSIRRV